LPFPPANKKVPRLDESGNAVEPETAERDQKVSKKFIFAFCPPPSVLSSCEVDPAKRLRPVKNADGAKRTPKFWPRTGDRGICIHGG